MILHPTILIIFFIFILILIKNKYKEIFTFISFIFPVLSIELGTLEGSYELYNLKLMWQYKDSWPIIYSYMLIIPMFNLYAIWQNKINELIFGGIYGGFAIFTLLADDFVSMFIGIEIMMVISTIIIFIGGSTYSRKAAKQYFLTHLVSSNMILIGVAHILIQSGNTNLTLLTDLINNPLYSKPILYIMLTGMLVNIAIFPFCGWMVNCYSCASPTGFLYLISFTTKVSLILLLKIFAGLDSLKYVAIFMILYAGFKGLFEDHILKLLCYLSIISMGVIILGISLNDKIIHNAVLIYLQVHIMYKALLSISAATIIDKSGLKMCSYIRRIDEYDLKFALFLGVILMINFPFGVSFFAKSQIASGFTDTAFYLLTIIANIFAIICVPWRRPNGVVIIENLSNISTISIFIMTIFVFLENFLVVTETFYISDIIKQLIVLTVGALIVYYLKQIRYTSNSFNLIDFIASIFEYLYNKFLPNNDDIEKNSEDWNLSALEDQILRKISIVHNQQTAIFVAFVFLIVLLCIL